MRLSLKDYLRWEREDDFVRYWDANQLRVDRATLAPWLLLARMEGEDFVEMHALGCTSCYYGLCNGYMEIPV